MRLLTGRQWILALALILVLAIAAGGCQDDDAIEDCQFINTGSPGISETTCKGVTSTLVKEASFECGHSFTTRGSDFRDVVFWSADNSSLYFSRTDILWNVDVQSKRLTQIVDVNPEFAGYEDRRLTSRYGSHAAMSPDGTQIAYASCQFPNDDWADPEVRERLRIQDGPEWYERYRVNYELVIAGPDGSNQVQLTANRALDHYPEWSPDGKRIAFIREENSARQLYTMSSDGQDVQPVIGSITDVSPLPLAWSPNGEHVAFMRGLAIDVVGRVSLPLLTVRLDGTEVAHLGNATTLPTWSPDGSELAFATYDAQKRRPTIVVVRPDGTAMREVKRTAFFPITEVQWSPDGSSILYVSDGVYLVDAAGNSLPREVTGIPKGYRGFRPVAWSPDGSRIAIYSLERGIITISPDGTDLRYLVKFDRNGQPHVP